MANDTSIFLAGFMGTGKTTVGRLLAERLGRPFVDMDDRIEARAGKTISAIFAEEGESAFRALEREIVAELAGRRGIVAAAGGGAVMDPANTAALLRAGLLVCLWARPDVIWERVRAQTHRPLLESGDDKRRAVLELLEKRSPVYHSLPVRVDTSDLTPAEVVERILHIYSGDASRPPGPRT
jgi:shikimate kinase